MYIYVYIYITAQIRKAFCRHAARKYKMNCITNVLIFIHLFIYY